MTEANGGPTSLGYSSPSTGWSRLRRRGSGYSRATFLPGSTWTRLFGFIYTVSPAGELLQDSFASRGCSARCFDVALRGRSLEPDTFGRAYLTVDAAAASEIPLGAKAAAPRTRKREGVLDSWAFSVETE